MTSIVAIVSHKGGVGKTTVALNLALAMAEQGRKMLLVDVDPQGGVGHALAKGDTELSGIAEILGGVVSASDAVLHTKHPNLSLLPRGRLDPVQVPQFEAALAGGERLKAVIDELSPAYGTVLIDTPSGLGICTRAAMHASNFVLMPLQAEPLALRSVAQTLEVLEHVRAHENANLQLLGIVATMVDDFDDVCVEVVRQLRQGFPAVFDSVVPRDEVFARASLKGLPVSFLGGTLSPEARSFVPLAHEVSARSMRLASVGETDEQQPERQLL